MPRSPRAAAPQAAAPAAPALAPGELQKLAADYLRAAEEIKKWEAFKKSIAGRLTVLHTAGLVPTKFAQHGYNFGLQNGRTTVKLDTIGKGCVDQLKQELIAKGHGVTEQGDPFWAAKPIPVLKNQESLANEAP